MTYLSLTLKVCEGCGSLWLRAHAGLEVYCGVCTRRLKDFPDPKTRRRLGRPRKDHREVRTAAQSGAR